MWIKQISKHLIKMITIALIHAIALCTQKLAHNKSEQSLSRKERQSLSEVPQLGSTQTSLTWPLPRPEQDIAPRTRTGSGQAGSGPLRKLRVPLFGFPGSFSTSFFFCFSRTMHIMHALFGTTAIDVIPMLWRICATEKPRCWHVFGSGYSTGRRLA